MCFYSGTLHAFPVLENAYAVLQHTFTEKEEQRGKLTPTVRTASLLFAASRRGILLIMPRPQTFCFQKA